MLWDPPQTAPSGGGNSRASRPADAISDGEYMRVITTEALGGKINQGKQTVTVVW